MECEGGRAGMRISGIDSEVDEAMAALARACGTKIKA